MKDTVRPVDLGKRQVIFFDGHCVLCNRFLDFIISRDHGQKFYYASLQGEAAARLLPTALLAKQKEAQGPTSVILHREKDSLQKSDAALRIISQLGFPWNLCKGLLIIPRPIRDRAYDFVAKNRYHWFGRVETCRLPSPEEDTFFLK